MNTRALTRGITGALFFVLLLGCGAYYYFIFKPVQDRWVQMSNQFDQVEKDRKDAVKRLLHQKDKFSTIGDEMQRLKLFDLRSESAFDTVLANRSNVGLIAVSEIIQRNHLVVDTLSPGAIDSQKVVVQSVTQGGILHRKYLMQGQGRYTDVQNAFKELKTLPPTLEVDRFDVEFVAMDAGRAIVTFDMDFGFNYLVSAPQLDRFKAMQAEQSGASGSVGSQAFGISNLVKGAGSVFGFNGRNAQASGDATVSLLPRAVALSLEWWMPAAEAAPAPPSVQPVPTTGRPAAASGSAQAMRGPSPRPTINPALRAGGKATAAASASPLVMPRMLAQNEAEQQRNKGAIRAYTFRVEKGISLGRSEPFMPLAGARLMPIETATESDKVAVQMVQPMPETTLLAVLLSTGGPSSALIQYGDDRLRVRPGSSLPGGAMVSAVGRDFILIRYQGTLRKVGLLSESGFGPGGEPSMGSPLGTMPVPRVPAPPTR